MAKGRRLPTADELRVWRDFIETTEALRSELASRLQHESALSPGDYVVLLALGEAPEPRIRSSTSPRRSAGNAAGRPTTSAGWNAAD